MASRLLRVLLLTLALVVTLATAFTITSLRARADGARVTQTKLAKLGAGLSEESGLEWKARATGRIAATVRGELQGLKAERRGLLSAIARTDRDDISLKLLRLVEVYESAVDDMFGAIVGGHVELAGVVDELRADPAYEALRGQLASADRLEGQEAVEIFKWTAFWTYFSLLAALVTLTALFWHFRHIEEKRSREYARSLEHEATHDHLTGLPNRRRLMNDLYRPNESRLLGFFDLDGFKTYNDTYGHVEGDLMLQRLSRKLGDAVAGRGRAYRLGGDEFCVVAPLMPDEDGDALVSGCVEALSEDGEGFHVRASWGCVRMPAEATSSAAALMLADQRMYKHKGSGRSSARQQTRDLVLRVLAERRPDLN